MGLETGTFVEDLIVTNPPGGDDKRQGDDHLRLIKTVLRNTFKRATKAFFLPTSAAKSSNYTIVATDDNTIFVCDTTVEFTLTLPTLVLGDAGWSVRVIKTTSDMNAVYIQPPSGTINGFAKIRRSVPFVNFQIVWTGGNWVAERAFGVPIGSEIGFHGTTLPPGCLWPNGAAVSATTHVELRALMTNLPDRRGRIGVAADNLGGAAGRLTLLGGAGSVGGAQETTILQGNLPSMTVSCSVSGTLSGSAAAQSFSGATDTTQPSIGGIPLKAISQLTAATPVTVNSPGGSSINIYPAESFAIADGDTITIGATTGGGGASVSGSLSGATSNFNPSGFASPMSRYPLSFVHNVVIVAE